MVLNATPAVAGRSLGQSCCGTPDLRSICEARFELLLCPLGGLQGGPLASCCTSCCGQITGAELSWHVGYLHRLCILLVARRWSLGVVLYQLSDRGEWPFRDRNNFTPSEKKDQEAMEAAIKKAVMMCNIRCVHVGDGMRGHGHECTGDWGQSVGILFKYLSLAARGWQMGGGQVG